MLTPAERLFSETHGRTLRAWGTVSTFRQVVEAGFVAAATKKAEEAEFLYDQLISDPDYMKLLTDVEGFRRAMTKEKFVELGVSQSAQTATNLLNAATILFGHSMIDGAVFDYCRVTALHAPNDWEPELSNKQVPLSSLRERTFDEILRVKLDDHLKDVEMKSLREKINRLHARCRPEKGWSPMNGYAFDLDRIERLDLLRQDIVHGDALGRHIEDAFSEFEYMNRSCWYFMGLVNMRYGLKLDPYLTLGSQNGEE